MKILYDMLKEKRKNAVISIRELARQTGISASSISQIENGKTTPSITAVKKIAEALKTTIGELIGEKRSNNNEIIYIKRDERRSLVNFGDRLTLQFLATMDKYHKMEPTIQILGENTVSGKPPYQHEGDEFIYVISGSIKLNIGDQEYYLCEGDSVYFNANIPHSIINPKNNIAEVLFVTSPPYF